MKNKKLSWLFIGYIGLLLKLQTAQWFWPEKSWKEYQRRMNVKPSLFLNIPSREVKQGLGKFCKNPTFSHRKNMFFEVLFLRLESLYIGDPLSKQWPGISNYMIGERALKITFSEENDHETNKWYTWSGLMKRVIYWFPIKLFLTAQNVLVLVLLLPPPLLRWHRGLST